MFITNPHKVINTKEDILNSKIEKAPINLKEYVRNKIIDKLNKNQMTKPRWNRLIIHLDCYDESYILSALSDGYKLKIDLEKKQIVEQGYDWSKNIFNDPRLNYVEMIVYFLLGDYENKKFFINPNFAFKNISDFKY